MIASVNNLEKTASGDKLVVGVKNVEIGFSQHFAIRNEIASSIKKIEAVFADKFTRR